MENTFPHIVPGTKTPILFERFFEMGKEETVSPFLRPESRPWGANLTLKASIIAAIFLLISFTLSFLSSTLFLSYLFLIPVYFLAGIPALIESIEDLINFEVNIDILMTLAAFSSVLIGSGMEGGLLLVLFALSGSMEDAVREKAKGAISSLHKLSPNQAVVVDPDGNLIERSVNEVEIGTNILVKAGQVVPLDGEVIEGISSVNLVHLTGENFPVTKKVGDEVPAGARNLEGAITLNVTRTSADSTLAKIIELVTQAQEAKPALQRWFDTLSRTYAITIILLSAFFTLTFPYIFNIPLLGIEGSLYRALAFLIAASPCALIIAIPIAYLSAISICARRGVVMKGGTTLDALAGCDTIVFDKTGTLTTGELTCLGISGLEDRKNEALSIALAMERNAVHPVAKAILDFGEKEKINPSQITDFKSIPGYGLEAKAGDYQVFIGNVEYIIQKIDSKQVTELQEKIKTIKARGELVAIMLLDEEIFIFRFRDTPRPKIRETLKALKHQWNMQLVMLTGDHRTSAKKIADEMEIDQFYSDLRPEDKLKFIAELSQEQKLAMVGDGINDAPALARSHVGICMGKVGSTPAIDAADIVLLHDNIEILPWLVGKSRATKKIVIQNLTVAASAILIASIPALSGVVPLWLAVVMHEGGTVLVGLNALRLLKD